MSAPTRRSVHVDGLGHGSLPIPVASRVGQLIATGGVRGVDPATGLVPADLDAQVSAMLDNLVTVIEAAGGTAVTIAKVTVWTTDRHGSRDALNRHWIRIFPDGQSRPARHVIQTELPSGMLVQCEAIALALPED